MERTHEHVAVQNALARLQTGTATDQRFDILEQLVAYWHPPVCSEDGMQPEEVENAGLPLALVKWFLWAGRRPEIMSGQNRLLPPQEIVAKDGVLLFYIENQGVYQWGTTREEDDPAILGRYQSTDPWTPEGMTMSEHLIRMCLFEAIISAPYCASTGWLRPAQFERIREGFPVALRGWRWPGPSHFYVGNGVFMHACTYPEDQKKSGYSLWIGSKAPEPMEFLRPLIDDSWDHVEF